MTSLFEDDGAAVTQPETKESPRQQAEKAFRDLTNRNLAQSAIHRAGRNASGDDLRSIAFFLLEEAKARGAK